MNHPSPATHGVVGFQRLQDPAGVQGLARRNVASDSWLQGGGRYGHGYAYRVHRRAPAPAHDPSRTAGSFLSGQVAQN